MFYRVEIDLLEAKVLGAFRQMAHHNAGNSTPRFFNDVNHEDVIGVAGELAFEKRFDIPMDQSINPRGDGHIDFVVDLYGAPLTLDIKTATNPFYLLVKDFDMPHSADIIILAGIDGSFVQFLGWEHKETIAKAPKKEFGYGITNHHIHRNQLRSMHQLEKILKGEL